MKKRWIALALALALVWITAAPAAAADTGYSDVPDGHWSAGSIRRATELEIFRGVGGEKFGFGQPITRAAFVTALVRLFGWKAAAPGQSSFSDVPADSWYRSAVETALANGAVAASGPDFRPTDNITREEMANMIVRALGYTSLAARVSEYDASFTDVTSNAGFITMAYDMGIVSGVGGKRFDPRGIATREQAAVMLMRVYDRLYAASTEVDRLEEDCRPVRVDTPEAQEDTPLPVTPLEPIAGLYDALRQMKQDGQDMSQAVLCLSGGGVRTVTSNGRTLFTQAISAGQVELLLRTADVETYFHPAYQSAYCVYTPNDSQTITVWYQSEESLAAKLLMGRLFGVTRYYIAP